MAGAGASAHQNVGTAEWDAATFVPDASSTEPRRCRQHLWVWPPHGNHRLTYRGKPLGIALVDLFRVSVNTSGSEDALRESVAAVFVIDTEFFHHVQSVDKLSKAIKLQVPTICIIAPDAVFYPELPKHDNESSKPSKRGWLS
eukprot:270264-Prymnesium_polylepis.1